MVEALTVNELLKKGIDLLGQGDFLNPLLDAQLLLCHVLNVDKIYIYTQGNKEVSQEDVDKFLKLITLRKERYPLQYILGSQEFMGLDFYVGEGVLIPRPDTEVLVESIIDIVKEGPYHSYEKINILDIGTGSGAITLSLAHYIKKSFVYSVDISPRALDIAKNNARRLNLESKVCFLEGDLFSPIDPLNLHNKIDIIVSNPPYIPTEEIDNLQREVSTYEPRLALDGGMDGLDYYRQITKEATRYLSKDGILAFEIGYNQGEEVKELLIKEGFSDVKVIKDLPGKDRVVLGIKSL